MNDEILDFLNVRANEITILIIDEHLERIEGLSVTLCGKGSKISEKKFDLNYGDSAPCLEAISVPYIGFAVFEVNDRVRNCVDDLTYKRVGSGQSFNPKKIFLPL